MSSYRCSQLGSNILLLICFYWTIHSKILVILDLSQLGGRINQEHVIIHCMNIECVRIYLANRYLYILLTAKHYLLYLQTLWQLKKFNDLENFVYIDGFFEGTFHRNFNIVLFNNYIINIQPHEVTYTVVQSSIFP